MHGGPTGLTPQFDRIAREGTLIEQAITPNPVCAPAAFGAAAGRPPTARACTATGCRCADLPTLAGWFAAAGYATGYIGKWHLAGAPNGRVRFRGGAGGYQEWLASRPSNSPRTRTAPSCTTRRTGRCGCPATAPTH
ncbi:sulfatase-like hydrolase/transferase [Streptomyces sp. KL116D]|uniref:sulfatase-like hydrolase/transferase n=1 Tax=Streptomyces sp. KL116D TaxID=3045152 RepID=UPI003557E0F0